MTAYAREQDLIGSLQSGEFLKVEPVTARDLDVGCWREHSRMTLRGRRLQMEQVFRGPGQTFSFGQANFVINVCQTLEGSRVCYPRICLFEILIILGWFILRNGRHGKNSETQVEATLYKRTFIFVREISICKGVFLTVSGKGGYQNLWKVLNNCMKIFYGMFKTGPLP